MNTKFKQLLIAMFTLAFLAILPAAVKADPITLTLDPTHSVAQGSSVTYSGSLSNGGLPGRFINAVSLTYTGPAGITFNDSAFFTNVPAFLGSGATTGVVSFFDVFADLLIPPGNYIGSFSVLGGVDDQDQNILATQEFTIMVTPSGPPIPEPASMLLLASGLAGAAALRRRKRSQSPTP
ncbi:MAG TPA: PEP-CTERM sorting domain-containing protein [Candidatus Binatia bacterium]|nr:PEP-CTERM sorting domain-containing protein [Candidatus Binatia bacterium]